MRRRRGDRVGLKKRGKEEGRKVGGGEEILGGVKEREEWEKGER